MQSDQSDFKPLDPGRVDMLDQFERHYWCATFRCTETELERAITQVGEHVTAVREYLASNR